MIGRRPGSLEAAASVTRKLVASAAYDVLEGPCARCWPFLTTPSVKFASGVQ
jgi:hypothetical protein